MARAPIDTSADDLRDRKLAVGDDDERTVADLLVEQIEFANALVVSKLDLVSPEEAGRLTNMLRRLNADARIISADHGNVPLDAILGTRRPRTPIRARRSKMTGRTHSEIADRSWSSSARR